MIIRLVLAAISVVCLAAPGSAAASSLSISISPDPALAGGTDQVTVTGSTDPSTSIRVDATEKPAGGVCAANPDNDTGEPFGGYSTDPNPDGIPESNPDGSFNWQGTFRGGMNELAGSYLLCGWLQHQGTILATTQRTLTVNPPHASLSLDGPAGPLPGYGHDVTLGAAHWTVDTDRALLAVFKEGTDRSCPAHFDPNAPDWRELSAPYVGPGDAIGPAPNAPNPQTTSGSQTYTLGFGPRPGRYVMCAYIGDENGKETDARAGPVYFTVNNPAGGASGGSSTACVVPNVVGKQLRAAKRALKTAHCRAGKIKRKRGSRALKGRVVSQWPQAGTRKPAGAKIALTIAR